jgi:ankyrin repeat protein
MRIGSGHWRVLNWAIAGGSAGVVEMLLRNGADVNPCGDPAPWPESPPLHAAIGEGCTDLAELLLRRGAKVDAQDYYGYTALHRAVQAKNVAAVRFLLERAARVDTTLNQNEPLNGDLWGDSRTLFTPLHTAAEQESPALVALLLKHGASVKLADSNGRTPLDLAAAVPYERHRVSQCLVMCTEGKLTPARALCVVILIRAGAPTGTPLPRGERIIP